MMARWLISLPLALRYPNELPGGLPEALKRFGLNEQAGLRELIAATWPGCIVRGIDAVNLADGAGDEWYWSVDVYFPKKYKREKGKSHAKPDNV